MAQTRVVSVRLGIDLVEEIDRLAAFHGKNRNRLVNDLLELAVRNFADSDVIKHGLKADRHEL